MPNFMKFILHISDFGYIRGNAKSLLISFSVRTKEVLLPGGGGGAVLQYMGHIGMCHCKGYGFQAVTVKPGQAFPSLTN